MRSFVSLTVFRQLTSESRSSRYTASRLCEFYTPYVSDAVRIFANAIEVPEETTTSAAEKLQPRVLGDLPVSQRCDTTARPSMAIIARQHVQRTEVPQSYLHHTTLQRMIEQQIAIAHLTDASFEHVKARGGSLEPALGRCTICIRSMSWTRRSLPLTEA